MQICITSCLMMTYFFTEFIVIYSEIEKRNKSTHFYDVTRRYSERDFYLINELN